jgi:hypothetical protein
MRRITSTLTAVCAATLLTVGVATAQGTLPDRKTNVTFSGPVSIPGATLPAGTYVFRIADSQTNRNIVQIFDKDELKLITTILAVAAERPEPEGDPVITFKETAADRPPAVRYWYYAGEKAGNEFIYPRAQAMMIARASGESVPAFDTDSTDIDAWKKGGVSTVTSSTEAQSSSTTAATPEPAPAPTTVPPAREPEMTPPAPMTSAPSAAATQPEPPATPVGTSGRAENLPRTASELPLVGLIGLVALTGALALRAARRATV